MRAHPSRARSPATVLGVVAALAIAAAPLAARAQCVAKPEEGRWRNPDPTVTEPAFVNVGPFGCSDVVLNGQQPPPQTQFPLAVGVRQSDGHIYWRHLKVHWMRATNGVRRLTGHVSTGGYDELVWARAAPQNGKPQLNFIYKLKSLDSKPDGPSHPYWLVR